MGFTWHFYNWKWLKCSLYSKNRSFPYFRLFSSSSWELELFSNPLEVRVIGSRLCIINTVVFDFLAYGTHVFFQDVEQASLYIIIKICPKQGQGFKPSAAHLYQKFGGVPPPPPPPGSSRPWTFLYLWIHERGMAREEARSFCQTSVTTIHALKSRS